MRLSEIIKSMVRSPARADRPIEDGGKGRWNIRRRKSPGATSPIDRPSASTSRARHRGLRIWRPRCSSRLSVRDIEDAFKDENGRLLLPKTAVSQLGERLWEDYQAFAQPDLSEYEISYLFVDGIAERLRPGAKREPVLAAWGFTIERRRTAASDGRVERGHRDGDGVLRGYEAARAFGALIRAAERWKSIKVTEFERRQFSAVKKELDQENENSSWSRSQIFKGCIPQNVQQLSDLTKMNSVLSEILETGATKIASGTGTVKVHSSISLSEGQFLQKLVRQLDPTISLEVGLAYGVSALFICDALNVRSETQHIVIDPNQHDDGSWDGIGIANLRRAGYADIVRLVEAPSYRALAELEGSGQRIDFAFIDGWHTFDFCLVDLFFIDRMLNVGGVVALDDANWPAIRKVCRFVKTNLAYSVVEASYSEPSLKRRVFGGLFGGLLHRRPFRMVLRPEVIVPDSSIGLGGSCIAFRKDADDSRRWDHFVDF